MCYCNQKLNKMYYCDQKETAGCSFGHMRVTGQMVIINAAAMSGLQLLGILILKIASEVGPTVVNNVNASQESRITCRLRKSLNNLSSELYVCIMGLI